MKQVRFWDYINGSAVLIKISVGETLFHEQGGRTDEGWSREMNEWTFDGETLFCRFDTDGVDCDGRMSTHNVSYCAAAEVRAGYRDEAEGISFPAWQRGEQSQRDYSAEAMGY